jgi:Polyketide cyclase / dehydrase and lipid transport
MTIAARSGSIAARPHEVWAVLADFGAISSWAPNVDHSCLLTEQDAGVGTARRIQTGRTTLVETVAVWTPPTTDSPGVLSYSLAGLPRVIRSVTNTWQLTLRGGATVVTLTSAVDAGPRPPQKGIARIVGRRLASASDEMIAGLTSHIATTEQNA